MLFFLASPLPVKFTFVNCTRPKKEHHNNQKNRNAMLSIEKTREMNEQALEYVEIFNELFERLEIARKRPASEEPPEREDPEEIINEIFEIPLEIEQPGENGFLSILLCTGGPAFRIIAYEDKGKLSGIELQWNDWWQPWRSTPLTSNQKDTVEAFIRFIFAM